MIDMTSLEARHFIQCLPRNHVYCMCHGGNVQTDWKQWHGINAEIERIEWERTSAIQQHEQLLIKYDEMLAQAEATRAAKVKEENRQELLRAAEEEARVVAQRAEQEAKLQRMVRYRQQIQRRKQDTSSEAELAELDKLAELFDSSDFEMSDLVDSAGSTD
jgi:hypothetical protein